jgi:uncharacterized phage-like protein YoqJ
MKIQQIVMTTEYEKPRKACVFTGHRELGDNFSADVLKREIIALLDEGVRIFYNGMAMGFDLLAAETLLSVKENYEGVKLIACIPCYNQEKSFPAADKKRYAEILKRADEQVLLAEHYFQGCMQIRDKYMADRADVMIAYCHKEKGGAAFTVKYFQKTKPLNQVIFI